MVHRRGFRGTERGEGHSWYTGEASEVRNGVRGTVGTQEGFRGTERGEGHGWYTGGDSEVRNGMEDTVGTREGNLRYRTG